MENLKQATRDFKLRYGRQNLLEESFAALVYNSYFLLNSRSTIIIRHCI